MDMQGQRPLPVAQEHVWAALNDPEILKACVPGCDKFEQDGEHAYAVSAALKIGPVSARFSGKVQLSDIEPPNAYTLQFEAQGGVAGFGKGQSKVQLTPTEAGCDLHYSVNATVGGKLAQLGQRLIDGVAKNMADDFFKRFEAKLLERHPAAVTLAPASAADGAGAVGGTRLWLWGGAALVVAMLAYLLTR
jgi:uncharacterized protein